MNRPSYIFYDIVAPTVKMTISDVLWKQINRDQRRMRRLDRRRAQQEKRNSQKLQSL